MVVERHGHPGRAGLRQPYADSASLIYMHARYNDPILRRFISVAPSPVDPGTAINFNRYAYVNNSPYRFFDPSRRESSCF